MPKDLKKLMLLVLLFGVVLSCINCRGKEEKYERLLIGNWKYTDMRYGVTYNAIFHKDYKLSQIFETLDGRTRMRPGMWKVSGDTLFIIQQTGEYNLLFNSINDSSMVLIRSDSVAIAFNKLK